MRTSLGLLLTAFALLVTRAGAQPATRPNILWVVCEDFTAHYSGPYGDPLARTPNMDRLAHQGVTFEQCHSSAPVCAPARSSIITGRYASSLGTQNMRSTPPLPDDVRFFPELLRQAGYFCTNNAKTDYNTSSSWASAWDENSPKAHWRHRKPGQPFFAVFNFGQSHESQLHKRVPLVTDPAKVRVPAYLPDIPEVRADLAQYYDCVSRADAGVGRILEQLKADGLEDNTIIFYYSDNGGCEPRSKRFLFDNGTHVGLVVSVPPALRRYAVGEAGTRNAELVNFIDLAPTVLSLAGVPRAPQFQGRVIFGPEKQPAPAYTFVFRDRMDERYDASRAVADGRYRYIRNYYPELPHGQHIAYLWQQASMQAWAKLYRAGKLNATQRAFFEPKGAEELYDCQTDPDNVHNLATDPTHQDTLRRFRSALHQHLVASRDTVFAPEPLMVGLAAGHSPAAVAADDRRYPLERLISLVDGWQLASTPDAASVRAALADENPEVRYWAASVAWKVQGLDLTPLLRDANPMVRLAAAEGLLRQNDNAAAWQVLQAATAADQTPELQLYAVNVVARVPRAWPASLRPRLQQYAAVKNATGFANYLGRASDDLLGNVPAPTTTGEAAN